MAYVVLARKWRPMVFGDVVGQEHITRTLMNALKNQRIAHAYIFAGPRGVGKTTTARLLAKAVNCEKQPAVNPCNECASCKSITDGHSLDVIEIDGASNRGIDEIRNLRENIRFAPASSRYKIYIIDEVHMLTKEAFNALLKTLEEPPSHAIFIFATTEIHRVPLTILSRCQRFDFKRIPIGDIKNQLHEIVKSENIDIDDEALLLISRKADGSMRDAESILDQMISFSDGKLAIEQVRESLGLIDQEVYFEFTDLLKSKDTAKIMLYANKVIATGHDLIDFLHGLQEHFRNFLIVSSIGDSNLLDVADFYRERYEKNADLFSERDLIHFLSLLNDAEQDIKFSNFPQFSLEMLLLKLAFKPSSEAVEEILAFIEKLKQNPAVLSAGSGPKNSGGTASGGAEYASEKASKYAAGSTSENENKQTNTQQEYPTTSQTQPEAVSNEFGPLAKTLSRFESLKKKVKTEAVEPNRPENEIDISDIKRKWPAIVEKVRAQKIALGSFLQEGIPVNTQGNKVIVAYDNSASFHKEHVEKNHVVIEEIIKNEFQLSVRLNFTTIDFKEQGIEQQPRTPEEILEDIKNKEPVIKKIIEAFDLNDLSTMKMHS